MFDTQVTVQGLERCVREGAGLTETSVPAGRDREVPAQRVRLGVSGASPREGQAPPTQPLTVNLLLQASGRRPASTPSTHTSAHLNETLS